MKAGPTGALFGSVTPTDIAEELWRTRKIRVDRRKIDLDVIKRVGRFSVPVHVFEGVTAEVKTLVVPEGGELPPEEELLAIEAAERAEAEAAERAHEEAVRATEAALAEEEFLDEVDVEIEAEADADAGSPAAAPTTPSPRPSPRPSHTERGGGRRGLRPAFLFGSLHRRAAHLWNRPLNSPLRAGFAGAQPRRLGGEPRPDLGI